MSNECDDITHARMLTLRTHAYTQADTSTQATGVARGGQSQKNWKVGNGGPITGCLFHRITKYSEFQDACVRFSFPVLTFRKKSSFK